MVHLFGTVNQVSGGLRFRPELHQSGSAAQSEPFRSDDLTLVFPQAQVLILQAPAQSYDRTRRAADRRQAGLARAFAAELHAQGIPVVLVLPPIEAELIAPLLKRLATWLTRRRPGFAALQEEIVQIQGELVRRLSKVPRGTSHADRNVARDAAWEVACDLCLYADPNWDGWTFTTTH